MDRKREIMNEISELYREIEDLQQELKELDKAQTCQHQWVVDEEFLIDYPKALREDAMYCKKCNIDKDQVQ